MEIKIREMTYEDLPFFNEVRSKSYKFLHNQTNYTLEQNQEWFKKTNPRFYIAEYLGSKIGYFRTSNWGKREVTIGMDIAEDWRGYGLAVPAYTHFFKILKQKGILLVKLEVLKSNIRAKHIYDKLGFNSYGKYPHNNDMTIKMAKIL